MINTRSLYIWFIFPIFFKPTEVIRVPSEPLHINNERILNWQKAVNLNENTILIVADSIVIDEDLEIYELDLILVCSYFGLDNKRITIYPNNLNDSTFYIKDGHGRVGRNIKIITRSSVTGSFIVNGGKGRNGLPGAHGANGIYEFRKFELGIHRGEKGKDGENGGDGGNGGSLIILTMDPINTNVRFQAEGGALGNKGDKGKGGLSYRLKFKDVPEPRDKDTIRIVTRESDGLDGKRGVKGSPGSKIIRNITDSIFITELKKFGIDDSDLRSKDPLVNLLQIVDSRIINMRPIQVAKPGQVIKNN